MAAAMWKGPGEVAPLPSEKRGDITVKEALLVGFCAGLSLGLMLFELIMKIVGGC